MVKPTTLNRPGCYRHKPPLAASFLFAFTLALAGCDTARPHHVFTGAIMGTSYSVQIAEALVTPEQLGVEAQLASILAEVDQAMSTYKPESELSQFNRSAVAEPVTISAELLEVLQTSLDVHRHSNGAFDVSVGPLVDLWGFGASFEQDVQSVPSDEAIAQALAGIGLDALSLDRSERTATRQKDIQIDLSAVAKGYAVDRLVRHLTKLGLKNYLVEVGGELRAAGVNKHGRLWTIGIETPSLQRAVPYQAVSLKQKAIATSGDYRNYFEHEGRRYSHTLDPRNGRPVKHHLASVTVVHDTAAQADAWATALNVLGPEDGLQLANQLELAAYFILRSDEAFESKESSAFSAYNQSISER